MSELGTRAAALVDRVADNSSWRQHRCFNLIPSETTPSFLVKMCEISDPAGRYAEHRTMKGKEIYFYQGIDFIREVEEEARAEMRKFFGSEEAELRPISGQMANEVVFKAITKFINRGSEPGQPFRRMSAVMNNDLTKGGHLSSQPMGALFNYVETDPATGKERVVSFPIRSDNPYRTDVDRLKEMIHSTRPELIVFGKSMFIYPEPVAEVAEVIKDMDPKPLVLYDMAHVLGLYGAFQEPLAEGADLVTGSTHKTFFGPQRGIVVSNMVKNSPYRKLWVEVKSRTFPGSTSNHHLGTLVGLLMAAYEMNAFKQEYQTQVIKNAKAFAAALADRGIQVEGDPSDGYTQTHQVLIRVRSHGYGEDIARRLEENNIVVNFQALPDDESFLNCSGIRMGVQEMTRFGMKESDFDPLAGLISDVVVSNKNVKEETSRYRGEFLTMHYCLPPQEAASMGARILAAVMPDSGYAQVFADNLPKSVRR